MRNIKLNLTTSILLMALLFSGCKKVIDNGPVIPGEPITPGETSSYVSFGLSGLQPVGDSWYALVSVESADGQQLFTKKKVTLGKEGGQYKTEKIKINKGDFKITEFYLVKASDTAFYATPKVNTTKASQVFYPLPVNFQINNTGVTVTPVEVLKVNTTDSPSIFGYTSADFGFQAHFAVKLTLKMTVGQVVYDSLPGNLIIDAVNSQQEHWTREIDLQKGVTEVNIPDEYSQFTFQVNKWNTQIERSFSRSQLHAQMSIDLEGSRNPKRLVQELTFIENSSGLIPDTRTEFYYNSSNRLANIKFYQRSLQVSGLHLTNVYQLAYNNNLLDTIYRTDANGLSTGYTAFFYAGGKISNMYNKSYDQETGAAIAYSGSIANEVIESDYLFNNGGTMTYKIFTRNGNKISDQAISSTGGGEGGTYEYDSNINPKHQLGWPDLYFSNYSKNNLISENKGYGGSIPQVKPYKFEYKYDEDGYPTEALISYKGYTSGQHLYNIKTVYSYQ